MGSGILLAPPLEGLSLPMFSRSSSSSSVSANCISGPGEEARKGGVGGLCKDGDAFGGPRRGLAGGALSFTADGFPRSSKRNGLQSVAEGQALGLLLLLLLVVEPAEIQLPSTRTLGSAVVVVLWLDLLRSATLMYDSCGEAQRGTDGGRVRRSIKLNQSRSLLLLLLLLLLL